MASVSSLTEERFLKLRCMLSERIGSRRFSHTLGVEETIIDLGEKYLPGDIPRLRIAALLHDLTKEWTGDEQLAFCQKHGIPVSEEERNAPRILHAKTGAAMAAKEFSAFADDTVLDAIRRHTTGAAEMTVFDELLYLADYIEPTRTYPECRLLRKRFYEGYENAGDKLLHLHTVLRDALVSTLGEIEARGGTVCPDTLRAIEYLSEIIREN